MKDVLELLVKWWTLGVVTVACAGGVLLLVSRLLDARADNKAGKAQKERKMT